MPCRYQPVSLRDLSEDKAVSNLINTCTWMYELQLQNGSSVQASAIFQNTIRPFWDASAIPTPVRRRLLAKSMDIATDMIRDGHSTTLSVDSIPLRLLEIMLDVDIEELRVQLCCYYGCSHQTALLKLLASAETKGITSLELMRPTLLRLNTHLFQSILLSMTNLKHLILKNIASDTILKVIGTSCSQLEVLDISHSHQVTDNGIKNLLQIVINNSCRILNKRRIQSTTRKPWWHIIKSLAKKMKTKTTYREIKINELSLFQQEYYEKPTKLCSTLTTLNIANTNVTSHGILLALQNIANLETLGEYCYIDKALELLNKCAIPSKKLQLTMANACCTTASRLQVLCNTCTKLNRLTITEPLHSPLMLSQLPITLTTINLQNVPTEQTWLDGLYRFLSGPQSKILQEFFIKFQRAKVSLNVDLGIFLHQLVNIVTLSIDGIQSIFQSDYTNIKLEKLKKIHLSEIDNPKTLQWLLQCTPSLRVLHIYICLGLNTSSLIETLNTKDTFPIKKISQHLNCLYINDLPDGNIDTIKYIMDACPEIQKIGNISNWAISQEEINELNMWKHINNLNYDLNSNSHWYHSECFSIK